MSNQKKDYTIAIVAAAVSLAFIVPQQLQKNAADNTANLPATNKQVETNSDNIKSLSKSFRSEIDRSNRRLSDQIKDEIQLVRAEINRREPEVIKYVDTLDNKKKRHVDSIERRLILNESRLNKHIDTPISSHVK